MTNAQPASDSRRSIRLSAATRRMQGVALAIMVGAAGVAVTPGVTAATNAATVEGLQMPAWVIRDGRRRALRPNANLRPGDQVVTGTRARLRLRMAEGSVVKLGENAGFKIAELEQPAAEGGAFQGFLDVLKGAFRFTTTALSRPHRRNLRIRVAGVTAGIRGTDIWGKAAPDRDIVCLIEGNIEVQRGDEAPFEMNEPLSFYIAPKGQPALPVAPVDPQQLQQWAQETELQAGEGIIQSGGQWTVNLAFYRDQAGAEGAVARYSEAGYASDLTEVQVNGQTWYRVQINEIDGYGDALGLADDLKSSGLSGSPWVSKSP